jgi:hypothetical protein
MLPRKLMTARRWLTGVSGSHVPRTDLRCWRVVAVMPLAAALRWLSFDLDKRELPEWDGSAGRSSGLALAKADAVGADLYLIESDLAGLTPGEHVKEAAELAAVRCQQAFEDQPPDPSPAWQGLGSAVAMLSFRAASRADLVCWDRRLTELGTEPSPRQAHLGWALDVIDPSGLRVQLHTFEAVSADDT